MDLETTKYFFVKFDNLNMLYHFFFQANMLKKVVLFSLLCVLQFKFNHSRYVLIDIYDEDNGHPSAGCGDWCWASTWCTGNPRCPYCRLVGVFWLRCVDLDSTRIDSPGQNK